MPQFFSKSTTPVYTAKSFIGDLALIIGGLLVAGALIYELHIGQLESLFNFNSRQLMVLASSNSKRPSKGSPNSAMTFNVSVAWIAPMMPTSEDSTPFCAQLKLASSMSSYRQR